MYTRSIVWFRRDLRLDDNTALREALEKSKEIIPIFVIDSEILSSFLPNDSRVSFILDAIESMERELLPYKAKIYVCKGNGLKVIKDIALRYNCEAIFTNASVSVSGRKRDNDLRDFGFDSFVSIHIFQDAFLVPQESIPVKKVFTPFYNSWSKYPFSSAKDTPIHLINVPTLPIEHKNTRNDIRETYLPSLWKVDDWHLFFVRDWSLYPEYRNDVWRSDATTKLSPFLRFGIVSVRRVFEYLRSCSYDTVVLQKELAWREFFAHVMYHFPETMHTEFQEKRRAIRWEHHPEWLECWKQGKTGYPIVDAAMRQLVVEGFMHNRARMIVASFLTKDLGIDWREGERFFSLYLYDYDAQVNIGNWQWAASVGPDPKPMRIFNPMLQSERFDPDGIYCKKYIPEISSFSSTSIHNPHKESLGYASPLVVHKERIAHIKNMYYLSRKLH